MQLWGKVLGIRSSWARFREADIGTGFLRLGCIWAGSEVDIAGQVDYGHGEMYVVSSKCADGLGHLDRAPVCAVRAFPTSLHFALPPTT